MSKRAITNSRYSGSSGSPTNPFLKTIKKDKTRNSLFQRSRSPTPPPRSNYFHNSKCSINLLLPVFLALSILVLFYFSINGKNENILFCSEDVEIPNCIKCPFHGTCRGGHLKCDPGFIQADVFCIKNDMDNVEFLNSVKLYSKMKKYVASNIKSDCNTSAHILFANLENAFGNSKSYQEALKLLINNGFDSEYQIEYLPPDGFISFKPILNTKCKIKFFYRENRPVVFLFISAIVLTIILFFVIARNQRTHNEIKRCSREVVRNIKKSQRGEFKNASDFTLSISNPMSKFWDKIADEVERNPSITVLDGVNGKLWGYV